MNNSKKGAATEHAAVEYFMNLGYEVFKNCSPVGPADLILWNMEKNDFIPIDVKSYHPDRKEVCELFVGTKEQLRLSVRIFLRLKDGSFTEVRLANKPEFCKLESREASKYLGITRGTLGKIRRNRIPYKKINNRRYYDKEDLDQYLDTRWRDKEF